MPNTPLPITPLKYIGGKTQLAKRITALFPYAPPVTASPFIGGGAAECAMALSGIPVHACDCNANLASGFGKRCRPTPPR